MILEPPLLPPPVGAVQVPLFPSVTRPRFKQFVAVKAAAPEVVTVRSVSQSPELAAPKESVATVSVKSLVIETGLEDDEPLMVSAPEMVCVTELVKLMKFGAAIVREAKVFAAFMVLGPREVFAPRVNGP